MRIVILSQDRAEKFCSLKHCETSIIISISSTYFDKPKVCISSSNGVKDILSLKFNDTENTNTEYHGISEEDATKIKSFIDKYKNTSVDICIIHCFEGKSRSAGVGAAILEYLGYDSSVILKDMRYNPNIL